MEKLIIIFLSLLLSLPGLSQKTDSIYSRVDKPASFQGGGEAYIAYLSSELKIPLDLQKNGVSGKVYVQFVIDTKGDIYDVKILKDIGFGSDDEVIRFIRSTSGKWNPALIKDEKVKSQLVYPIKFVVGDSIDGYLIDKRIVADYQSALSLMKDQKYNEAIIIFDNLIKLIADSNGSFFNRGLCYFKLGNKGKACNDWQRAKNFGDKKIVSYIVENCN